MTAYNVKDLISNIQPYYAAITSGLPNLPYKKAAVSAIACRMLLNTSLLYSAVLGGVIGTFVYDKIPKASIATSITAAGLSYAHFDTTLKTSLLIGTAVGTMGFLVKSILQKLKVAVKNRYEQIEKQTELILLKIKKTTIMMEASPSIILIKTHLHYTKKDISELLKKSPADNMRRDLTWACSFFDIKYEIVLPYLWDKYPDGDEASYTSRLNLLIELLPGNKKLLFE